MYKLWANHGTALVTARVGYSRHVKTKKRIEMRWKSLSFLPLRGTSPSTDQMLWSCWTPTWNSTAVSSFFCELKTTSPVGVSSSRLLNHHGMWLRVPTTKTWRTSVSSAEQMHRDIWDGTLDSIGPRAMLQLWPNKPASGKHTKSYWKWPSRI